MPAAPDDTEDMLPFPPGTPELPANSYEMGGSLDSPQQSTHLDARNPDTWKKPDDVSWGSWFLKPGKPLRSRHKLLARYSALGKTNREIAQLLDYTESRVSVLLSHPKIKEEADLYRDRLYDQDLASAFKDLLPEALHAVEDVLKHEALTYKDKLAKTDTAKWVIEKIDGKAAQKLNVESGTLSKFFDILGKMQDGTLPPTLDVTPEVTGDPGTPGEPKEVPTAPAEGPDYNAWITENL